MNVFPTIDEWRMNTPSFCIDENVALVIKKVLNEHFSHLCVPIHYFDEVNWHYFESDCAFTCVRFDDDGMLCATPKSVVKKQIFMEFSSIDQYGQRRLCVPEARVQMYWKRHADRMIGTNEPTTPVKWGKMVKEILKGVEDVELSLICDKLAEKAREIMAKQYKVQVSNTPSEVYIMPSDFKSCMIGLSKEKFLIYDDIAATSIAYIVGEDNLLKARALLHETTYYKKPMKIMDRIYYHDSYYLAAMVKWANEHGYWHKTRQAMDWYHFTNSKGEMKVFRSLRIPAPNIKHRYIDTPYIDTFCKLCVDKNEEIYLAMKGARPYRAAGLLQTYNRRNVLPLLQDLDAKYCENCHALHRKENIEYYLAYDAYREISAKCPVCKSCAKNLIKCPVCGEHYVWNNLSGGHGYFGRYTFSKNINGDVYTVVTCGKCRTEKAALLEVLPEEMWKIFGTIANRRAA